MSKNLEHKISILENFFNNLNLNDDLRKISSFKITNTLKTFIDLGFDANFDDKKFKKKRFSPRYNFESNLLK